MTGLKNVTWKTQQSETWKHGNMETTRPQFIFRHHTQMVEPFKYDKSKQCFSAQVHVTPCVCMCGQVYVHTSEYLGVL